MRNILQRPPWRKKPTRTATEEALEELKEQGREEDTGAATPPPGGSGDPVTPSVSANKKAAEGHPSD